MNYSIVIDKLKSSGMILSNEIVLVCQDVPSTSAAIFGGAIGSAIASGKLRHYIATFSKERIQFFDIDKQTGEYLGTMIKISSSEILKLNISKLSKSIAIKTKDYKQKVCTGKKFRKFDQAVNVKAAFELLSNMKK